MLPVIRKAKGGMHVLSRAFALFALASADRAFAVAGVSTAGTKKPATAVAGGGESFSDIFVTAGEFVVSALVFVVVFLVLLKIVRILWEIRCARRLTYLRVTLPRADSKLDKERETKKDFKEKMGIMSVFFKSVHKIGDITFKDMVADLVFNHMKISLELVYEEGQISFYVATYAGLSNFIAQQITSNYPDAEVRVIDKKEYPEMKPAGYTLRAASVSKANDDVFPIKSYKYFEDDPLSTLTNNFGKLKHTDRAAFQVVIKPKGTGWNKKAKKAANLVSKGQYKGGAKAGPLVQVLQGILAPLYWLVNTFVNNERTENANAPGASSGDAYKIFNQAEQEAHKAMGESAGQPGYECSMRFLVSSDTPQSAEDGLLAVIGSTNIFTDEYNNKLDNPQYEDLFAFLFVPILYFEFRFRLHGFILGNSVLSTDELSTLYHFPDINYNRSPIIRWLEYKMISPPHNLKYPKDPTLLSDYKRDADGNVFTEDGSLLAVDKNLNLKRDDDKNFFLVDGTVVPVVQDGENKGKPVDPGKNPVAETKQRALAGFPLYKDGVLMGWNEYRNVKKPIYFMRKDRGRHHYIIGKSG